MIRGIQTVKPAHNTTHTPTLSSLWVLLASFGAILALTGCFVDFDTTKADTFSCSSDSDCISPLVCNQEEGESFGVCGEKRDPVVNCIDEDNDTYGEGCDSGPDCDDSDPNTYPGATEICDGKDNNCNCVGEDSCVVGVHIDEPVECDVDTDCQDPAATSGMICVENVCRFRCNLSQGVCAGSFGECVTTDNGDGTFSGEFVPCEVSGVYGPDFRLGTDNDEPCDDKDNNCNGRVDDSPECEQNQCDPENPLRCSTDKGICTQGVRECIDGQQGECVDEGGSPVIVPGQFEEVCDGEDNDCDGFIDNVPGENKPGSICPDRCPFGMVLVVDPEAAPGQGRFCIDQYEASRLDATADSAGENNTRAVSRPGVVPWTNLTPEGARVACRGPNPPPGQSSPFAAKRLCLLSEIQYACAGSSGATYPYGEYNGATCNGADAGVGSVALTDANPQCVADRGGSLVYNLSGNVGEHVLERGNLPRIFGGSFQSSAADMTCASDVEGINQQGGDIGFRCCILPQDP